MQLDVKISLVCRNLLYCFLFQISMSVLQLPAEMVVFVWILLIDILVCVLMALLESIVKLVCHI